MVMLALTCGTPALAQRNAHEPKPTPMRRSPPDTNAVHWHTIKVEPKPGLPKIHFYNKINPVWWFGNADDPTPPDWYRPDDKHRKTKWYFRNPLHNFTFYIIGLADKPFYRSGWYPKHNSDPKGGWDFDIIRRHILFLPHISYERSWCSFYFGWRERGNFGIKLNFHHKSKAKPAAEEASPPASQPGKSDEMKQAN